MTSLRARCASRGSARLGGMARRAAVARCSAAALVRRDPGRRRPDHWRSTRSQPVPGSQNAPGEGHRASGLIRSVGIRTGPACAICRLASVSPAPPVPCIWWRFVLAPQARMTVASTVVAVPLGRPGAGTLIPIARRALAALAANGSGSPGGRQTAGWFNRRRWNSPGQVVPP